MFFNKNIWLLTLLLCGVFNQQIVAMGIEEPLLTQADRSKAQMYDHQNERHKIETDERQRAVNIQHEENEHRARLETQALRAKVALEDKEDLLKKEEKQRSDIKNEQNEQIMRIKLEAVFDKARLAVPKLTQNALFWSSIVDAFEEYKKSDDVSIATKIVQMNEFEANPEKYFQKNGELVQLIKNMIIDRYRNDLGYESAIEDLKKPISFEEFSRVLETYRLEKRSIDEVLRTVTIGKDDKAKVKEQLYDIILNNPAVNFNKYLENLSEYLVSEPRLPIKSIYMTPELQAIVNKYRISVVMLDLTDRLDNVGCPKDKVLLFEDYFKAELLPDDIELKNVNPLTLIERAQEAIRSIQDISAESLDEIIQFITSENQPKGLKALSDDHNDDLYNGSFYIPDDGTSSSNNSSIQEYDAEVNNFLSTIQNPNSSRSAIKTADAQAVKVDKSIQAYEKDNKTKELSPKIQARIANLKAMQFVIKTALVGALGFGIYKTMMAPSVVPEVSNLTSGSSGLTTFSGQGTSAPSTIISSGLASAPRTANFGGLNIDSPTSGVFFKEHNSIPTNYSRSWISSALSGGK